MEAATWEAEMKKQGYVRFNADARNYKAKLRDAARMFTAAPPNLKKFSRAQLELTIENMKAQHRELQAQLTALSPEQEVEANTIRTEKKDLYKDVMRLKAELAKRK
jgi:hypothetical protein